MTKFIFAQMILIVGLSGNIDYGYLHLHKIVAQPAIPVQQSSIAGTVFDSYGICLNGIEIELINNSQKLTTQSDSKGNYVFQGLKSGDYVLETVGWSKMFALNAYTRKNIHLDKNESKIVNLSPLIWINDVPLRGATITGKVEIIDPTSTQPKAKIPQKDLQIFVQAINPYSLELMDQVTASITGDFKLQVPCLGNYLIQVNSPGYELEVVTLKVKQTTIEQNFTIKKSKD